MQNVRAMPRSLSRVRILVECSMMIAIGTVLANIKLFTMPNGGSITLVSMLPFILVSYRHGVKWGVFTGLVNSLLQMMIGWWAPPAGTISAFLGMILLDYVLAFLALGLAVVFAKPFGGPRKTLGVVMGTACVCSIRFVCSFLSGFLIWGSLMTDGIGAVIYSLQYNLSYMLPETVLTIVAAAALVRCAPQLFMAE